MHPYDLKLILAISVGSLVAGFGIMVTYNYTFIRYGIIVVALVLMTLMRKKLIGMVKMLVNIKKVKS